MSEQLDIFGNVIPWEEADPRAQAAKNKRPRKKMKQGEVDEFVFGWLLRFDQPLSCDEVVDRLKPVGLSAATATAAMKRLKNQHRLRVAGKPDENCERHQVLSNLRYVPTKQGAIR